jgi:NAD(P)-dependent dehydrogenase (short-subunit alcohol dehydrogenase family)/pimeloyl-ACP methyl ester carboxylesterase
MSPNQIVKSDNIDLAVYTWGEPPAAGQHKPTVVLVHGYPDAASVWRHTAEQLAAKFYVVAYDVRGAGRSTQPDHTAAYDLQHLVNDLATVVDAVCPGRPVHLVAHDWGSIQSWEAVTTSRMKGRIASYTTISGPSLDHAGFWLAQRLRSGAPEDLAAIARQAAHSWYIGVFHLPVLAPSAWKLGLDKLWPTILEKIEGTSAEASESQAKDGSAGVNLYRANITNRVLNPSERRTDIPVQLIFPKGDHFMIPEIWDDLPQWAPNLWRRDTDAGHWLQVSHPQLVADWAAEFIEFVESGQETKALMRARHYARQSGKPYAGQLVVVTGAGSGFGRETALMFAERGASVVVADINLEAAERTAELAMLLGTDAYARQVDVGNGDAMEAFAAWVGDELGAPDIVVNNAGVGMAGSFFDSSDQDWERVLNVNLWGVIRGSRLFGQQMLTAGKHGHIVNVASMGAFTPSRFMSVYNTSKAAVMMLGDCLRGELAGKGIHVSTVCPGLSNTGITQRTQFVGVSDDEQTRRRDKASKLYQRRNLKPETIAAAILDAVENRRDEVLVGAEAFGSRLLGRFLPSLSRRLARLDAAG